MKLAILYRGLLASCNYGCAYCPFAKRRETVEEHRRDGEALTRFVGWVRSRRGDSLSVLFTPWGEALTHRRYQRALATLTRTPHVTKAAIQTNLSCRLDWVEDCDKRRLALWTTFHPTEVPRSLFLKKCLELDARGVRFSVGVVGLKEHAGEIEALRRELPPGVYLWVNAYKRAAGYYTREEEERFEAVDPLFHVNNRSYESLGRACRCGSSVISVAGDGTVRRCHFIREPVGNIYSPDFESALSETPCTNSVCGCHIGYVHMNDLKLYDVFGDGVLERIPEQW